MRLSFIKKVMPNGFEYIHPINADTGEEVELLREASVQWAIDDYASMTLTVICEDKPQNARYREAERPA